MKRLKGLVRRVGRKLLTLVPDPPPPPSIPLTVVEEASVLARVADVQVEPLQGLGAISGAEGGDAVSLIRVRDVWHTPAFGAVFDDAGRVFGTSVRGALSLTPTLAALPNARREGDATRFTLPADAPSIPRATVFMAWSGLHNYADFLIYGLSALMVAKQAGALERSPPIAPPLLPWQAELLALLLGDDLSRLQIVEAPIVRLDEAVFATSMDHSPRTPGPLLHAVRDQVMSAAAIGEDPAAPKRIYVSRLGARKRVLVNEAELEAALEARGFTIVRPETLSVRDLIALFHRADVIVAPSGVALANVLFCKPAVKIVEVQPANTIDDLARDLAQVVGADWRAFVAPSPLDESEMLRPAAEFDWRLDLDGFLIFLDGAL